jgi:predicted membrane GTPase involved in stress response
MELTSIRIADNADIGAEMEVVHPATKEPFEPIFDDNGKAIGSDLSKPLNAYIRVLGVDSKEYQRRIRGWIEKNRAKTAKQIGLADHEKNAMESRIACVVGWRGIELNGKELECTQDNVRMVLTDPNARYLCEQIDEFMSDRANFTRSNGKG